MALSSSRGALRISSQVLRPCSCSLRPSTTRSSISRPRRRFSSEIHETPAEAPIRAARGTSSLGAEQDARPRWSYTPEGMRGPGFSINIVKDPSRTRWSVNEDPKKLDAMYVRLLGRDGDKILPDEFKWLAVTHKSFDYGRRGYNTKLAYHGRSVLTLETLRSIMASQVIGSTSTDDPYDRIPFQHPSLTSVDKLSIREPQDVMSKEKIAKLAVEVGLPDVIRWKPRLPANLAASGLTVVLNTTVLAIIGAISLQQGGEVAGKVAREKILRKLES